MRIHRFFAVALLGAAMAIATVPVPSLAAGKNASTVPGVAQLRARLAKAHPNVEIDSIRPTPLDNVYEVVSGTDVMYITGDGRYLIRGALIDLQKKENLTATTHAKLVHQVVDALDRDAMLVYKPAHGPAQHTVTVFTDTTCPYCRRLHEELMQMRAHYPVEVRYVMFPRAGPQSAAANQLRNVWCAADPQQAFTHAMEGHSVAQRDPSCKPPLKRDWDLGNQIGVNGTPYILLDDDGPVFSGYRPKKQLLAMLGIDPASAVPGDGATSK